MSLGARIAYGPDVNQWAEFRLPEPDAHHRPLVVNIHGGFWRAGYDLSHSRPLCAGLRRRGHATLNLEYRRVGNPGGGWPGTFDDVLAGLAVVHDLVADGAVDGNRVVLTGHSAGGHLALWAAGNTDVPVRGVVPVAAITDLVAAHDARLSDGGTAVTELLGGSPEEIPQRYASASPIQNLPLPVPAVLVHAELDANVPLEQSRAWVAAARAAGGDARLVVVAGEDHFDVLDPDSRSFSAVATAISRAIAR